MQNKTLKILVSIISILFIANCATVGKPLHLEKASNDKLFVYSTACLKQNPSQCGFNRIEEFICTADKNGDLDCKSLYGKYVTKNKLNFAGGQQ